MAEPERPLVKALASFADTLVSDFDISELFYRLVDSCTQLAEADEAGLLLVDKEGRLGIAAATSESTHLVELLQLQSSEGPCLDAFRSGEPVRTGPLTSAQAKEKWPKFAPMASSAGIDSVVAVPMRLRDVVLGTLNLFRVGPGDATDRDVTSAQILADLTTIAIIQDRAVEDARTVIGQLQTALDTRVSIEQAKGIVAARNDLDMTTAFERIRSYARSSNSRLSEVSARIISGELDHELLIPGRPQGS